MLVALDGSEYLCSRKIKCPQCSTRRRSDGGWNASTPFSAPVWSHPATSRSCPCRRSSSPRKTGRRSRIASAMPPSAGWPGTVPRSRICGRFISVTTCSPASRSPPPSKISAATSSSPASLLASDNHRVPAGRRLEEHHQTVCKRGKRTTTIYRWLAGVPLRATRRCHPGQLVLHRDPQRRGQTNLLQQLRH